MGIFSIVIPFTPWGTRVGLIPTKDVMLEFFERELGKRKDNDLELFEAADAKSRGTNNGHSAETPPCLLFMSISNRETWVRYCQQFSRTTLEGLFKMVIFMDKTTSGSLENDVEGKERKLPIRNPIMSLCKSDCVRGPPSLPWWSKENLKTCETKPDQDSRIPHPGILSSLTDAGAHGWIRDAGCIRPVTFSIASLMTSGIGYCLSTAILVSIYKGINELSRSSHPSRSGGHFPAHFLYAWLAKNFDAYELVGEASSNPSMAKFSGLGRAKSFQLEEAQELIGSGRGFRWHSSIINRLKETLMDDGKLSRADFAYFVSIHLSFVSYHCEDNLIMEHYCPDRFSRYFGFYQDVPDDLDFDNLPDSETMLCYHHMLTRYGTGSHVLLPGRCHLLERNTTHAFREWWFKIFISSTCSPHASDSKRKRSDLSDTNISKDEGKLISKPKLKIIHSGKPLEPFVPPKEDGSSRVKILGIDVVIPAMPILTIPIQSIVPLPQDELPVEVCEPSTKKVIELPPEGAENIMDILDAEPNPIECMGKSDDVNFKEGLAHGVCCPDDDEVESIHRVNVPSAVLRPQRPVRVPQKGISFFDADTVINEVDKNAARVLGKVILDKVCHTPFDGLPSLKGDFDSLYAAILQRGVDVTPLESKVKGLIKQECDFKVS
ncbi:hypothetical protein Cgig2_031595 [Carnegiea gigantea]|uniref:Aminotransferase-like plant mobile domain-containing protein n=1 Tax=Carnegiea gigantea TaxID=171969 RepID=A0A9Q1QG35_9CARY|nr:hypothetical protein Cgig2_031595 [Carnegiea gigantea]